MTEDFELAKERKQDAGTEPANGSFLRFFHNVIRVLEKNRFSIITATLYLLVLGIVRSYIESKWYGYQNFSFYLMSQHTMFNLPVLIIGVLLISIILKERPKKIFNIVLAGFFIVVMPPLVDRFAFGLYGMEHEALYEYWSFSEMAEIVKDFFTLQWSSMMEISSPGLLLMVGGLVVMSGLYALIKTGSIIRGMLTSVSIGGVIYFISNLPALMAYRIIQPTSLPYSLTALQSTPGFPGRVVLLSSFDVKLSSQYYAFLTDAWPDFGDHYLQYIIEQQRSISIISYFMILSIIFCVMMAWLFYRPLFRHLFEKINLWLLFMPVAAMAGVASVKTLDPTYGLGLALDFSYFPHMGYIFLTFMAVLLAWLCLDMDRELEYSGGRKGWHIDGTVTRYQYKEIRNAFGIMAILISFLLGADPISPVGWIPPALIISFFMIGKYVRTPLKKKSKKEKNHIASFRRAYPLLSMIAFAFGVYSPSMWLIMAPEITMLPGGLVDFLREADGSFIIQNRSVSRIPGFSGAMVVVVIIIFIISYYYSNKLCAETASEKDRRTRGGR